jgi:hypothetical protein
MQFLNDRGMDMTIVDYHWGGTAQRWAAACHAGREAYVLWLADAKAARSRSCCRSFRQSEYVELVVGARAELGRQARERDNQA